MRIDYRAELEKMRAKVNKRRIKPLRLKKPSWVERDPMNKIYTDMDILLQKGDVYWGVVVQANEVLFSKRPYVDCPGNVIFTKNEYFNDNPEMMRQIAHEIFSYKNTDLASEYYKKVVEIVTDEHERIFNYPIHLKKIELLKNVSHMFREEETILFTTMMFFRDYMPKGKLCSGIIPIVAAPELTDISIMLPKKYWTKDTIKMFVN